MWSDLSFEHFLIFHNLLLQTHRSLLNEIYMNWLVIIILLKISLTPPYNNTFTTFVIVWKDLPQSMRYLQITRKFDFCCSNEHNGNPKGIISARNTSNVEFNKHRWIRNMGFGMEGPFMQNNHRKNDLKYVWKS